VDWRPWPEARLHQQVDDITMVTHQWSDVTNYPGCTEQTSQQLAHRRQSISMCYSEQTEDTVNSQLNVIPIKLR